jgi:two-component sensor histidine kinase
MTEQNKIEESFHKFEELLNNIFENSPNLMWLSDENGTMIRMNQACRDNFLLKDEEVIGIYNVFNDNILEVQGFMPLVQNVFEKGITAHFIIDYDTSEIKNLNLSQFVQGILDVSISPIFDSNGKIINAIIQHVNVTEIVRSKEKIKKLLSEKELLLKEVHHRIKNNMYTIRALLELQAGAMNDAAAISALNDAANRVQSMMLLYDKLYRSDNFMEVSILKYIPSLITEILSNFQISTQVKVNYLIEDFVLDATVLTPFGIIINEILTNIMKYAFVGKIEGVITISIENVANRIYCKIHDNGNGFPEDICFENTKGFGLMLINMLVKQLDGNIRIEREKGTTLILDFISHPSSC